MSKMANEGGAVTDSKALRSAAFFESALDALSDLVLIKDGRSNLLWANEAFRTYYGMTNEELENLIDADHSDPDDTLQYVRDDREVVETGRTLDIPSEPITDACGVVRFFHTVKSPITGPGGQVTRSVGVSRRLRDQVEAVKPLSARRDEAKATLAELRAFLGSIPTPVTMLDARNRVICMSDAWSDLFGARERGGIGQPLEALYPDIFSFAGRAAEAVRDGVRSHQEGLETTIQGQSCVLNVVVCPWYLPSGQRGGAVVMCRDITTAFRQSRALERVNDELRQFTYRASHDLVSPLCSTLGFLDIADEALANGETEVLRESLGWMRERVGYMNNLVRDLRDLARSDAQEYPATEVSFVEVLDAVTGDHRQAVDEGTIRFEFDVQHARIIAPRVRIQQIVANLVGNGVKFANPTAQDPFVRVEIVEDANDAVIRVTDNGVGVPTENAERIFDIFERGAATGAGSGIGLYIVRKHAENLGGHARLVPSPSGTTFEVRLPLKPKDTH